MEITFDEKTADFLTNKDSKAIRALQDGIALMSIGKDKEKAAKETITKASRILLAATLILEPTEGLVAEGIGRVNLIRDAETGKRVNRKVQEKYLLEHGVSASLIAKAREFATSESNLQDQIRFTAFK
jgi:hypothetical protein